MLGTNPPPTISTLFHAYGSVACADAGVAGSCIAAAASPATSEAAAAAASPRRALRLKDMVVLSRETSLVARTRRDLQPPVYTTPGTPYHQKVIRPESSLYLSGVCVNSLLSIPK